MANRAVLIGVNRYKIPGADLRGCVNDVKNLQSVLTQYYGFGGSDITTLLDDKATKKAIQAAIRQMVSACAQGRRGAAALLRPRLQRAGQGRRRGGFPRRDPVPARSGLERSAHRRLAARHVRQAARRREPDGRLRLLPLRHRDARGAGARRAHHPPLPSQPLGPGGRRVRSQDAWDRACDGARRFAGGTQEE